MKLGFQTASLVCSACIFGVGLALGTYASQYGNPWEAEVPVSIMASAVRATPSLYTHWVSYVLI